MPMQEQFRRRRLPHWDKPGAIYFVTACLAGSIPAQGLLDIDQFRSALENRDKPENLSESEWKTRKWKQLFSRCDFWLDQRPAVRHLEDERLADEVEESLLHFAGERYALWACVVMPSHFHCVFQPLPDWVASLGESANERPPRERVMHSVKLHSARRCNRLLGQKGTFWQDESYDHCVDDVDELQRIIDYVELNPVKAGLCESREAWRFSSAWYRNEHGIEPGRPILGESTLFA